MSTQTAGAAASTGSAVNQNTGDAGGSQTQAGGDGAGQQTGQQQGGDPKPGSSSQVADVEITLPQGLEADPKALEEFKGMAKESGLTSETASKLVTWQLTRMKAIADEQRASWDKQGETWKQELMKDPVVGGQKFEATVQAANKAKRSFLTEADVAEIHDLGLDNWPPLVKAFARIGQAMAEDNSSGGGTGAGVRPQLDQKERLKQMYPNSPELFK